jgi:poly-gamma-glutamate synthesis protein (capsule biosynthesis protein)
LVKSFILPGLGVLAGIGKLRSVISISKSATKNVYLAFFCNSQPAGASNFRHINMESDFFLMQKAIFRYISSTFLMLIALFASCLYANDSTEVVLIGTGDTMLGSWATEVISDSGIGYPFENIRSFLSDSDVFFTNLEAPFGTGGQPFDKKYTYRVSPKMVGVLNNGQINIVSLANNHTMDYGFECLDETRKLLQANNIQFVGAGKNLDEARQPALIEKNGIKIGFLAYSLTFPEEFWATDTTAGTCFPWEEFVFDDVKTLKERCDMVVVSCHWGEELRETPKPYQVKLAHRLIDNGADLILGHHPHVVQGIENYRNKWIFYSLGNFIFGSYSESARESFILKMKIKENLSTTLQLLPINVYNKEVNFAPKPLVGAQKEAFLEKMKKLSVELNDFPLGINSKGEIFINKS